MKNLFLFVILLISFQGFAQSSSKSGVLDLKKLHKEGKQLTDLTKDEAKYYGKKDYEVVSVGSNLWAWKNDKTRTIKCPDTPKIMKYTEDKNHYTICLVSFKSAFVSKAEACVVVPIKK